MEAVMETEKARDIDRPVVEMTLGGKTYPLAFDFACFRIAEDVYELYYGRNLNFAEIIVQLTAGKIGAIMAILFGALVSGGQNIKWEAFCKQFKLDDIPGMQEFLEKEIRKALPEVTDPPDGKQDPMTKAAE